MDGSLDEEGEQEEQQDEEPEHALLLGFVFWRSRVHFDRPAAYFVQGPTPNAIARIEAGASIALQCHTACGLCSCDPVSDPTEGAHLQAHIASRRWRLTSEAAARLCQRADQMECAEYHRGSECQEDGLN
jgi:hypothetical protein